MLWALIIAIVVIGVVVLYNREAFDNDTMIIIQGSQGMYPRLDFNEYMRDAIKHNDQHQHGSSPSCQEPSVITFTGEDEMFGLRGFHAA